MKVNSITDAEEQPSWLITNNCHVISHCWSVGHWDHTFSPFYKWLSLAMNLYWTSEKGICTRYESLGQSWYQFQGRRPVGDSISHKPCLQLHSQPLSITAFCPISNYTASWQSHMSVNSLPTIVYIKCREWTPWSRMYRLHTNVEKDECMSNAAKMLKWLRSAAAAWWWQQPRTASAF